MPENILVVEYEPRYTDRVKQALAGQPFQPQFAKDGDEALRYIGAQEPRLIVLSSVVPKVSTPELIRAIRNRKDLATTPILITISGYNGKTPRADAVKMGASDILPKPYSESEFLGKVQQLLGVRGEPSRQWTPSLDTDFTPAAATPAASGLTSNEIFGELLEDDRAPSTGARKAMKPKDDLDKMLADTLAGVMPQRKKEPAAPAAQPSVPKQTVETPKPAPAEAKPKTQSQTDLDKLLNDTLSGLEKPVSKKTVAATPVPAPPAPQPPPAAPPAPPRPQQTAPPTPAPAPPSRPVAPPVMPTTDPKYTTAKLPVLPAAEKVPVSQPIIAPAPPAPAPAPVAHEEEEPTDGIKFGQYVLLEKIATGGMAEVWKARMRGVEGFQKTVAIKKILPHLSDNQDFIEMFIDEAKLAAQLNHNNIIHIYDLGKIQSSYYIAMEYIDGYDLKTILKKAQEKDQPLNVELALLIASKIAAALDYAHRKRDFDDRDLGLVHRDVSPQNVLISEDGDIKLCDFGIAKAASKASHTQAGALKGKLQYMSPEQAWGRNIDKRSDIFALATVLFELLTGRRLFTGDNELSILEQVREARVAPPSQLNDEVTPGIDAIVLKALQKDPVNRYQTAGEMERDINQVLYTFKPTPTSADLAIYMHRLSTAEAPILSHAALEQEPVVHHDPKQLKPAVAPMPIAPVAPVAMPAPPVPPAMPTLVDEPIVKKPPVALFAIAAVVVIGIVVGAVMFMRGKSSTPAANPALPKTASTAPGTAPVPVQTASTATTASASGAPLTVPQTTTLDPAKIDAEVQKRLAAEKAKLEQSKPTNPIPNQPAAQQIAQTRPNPTPAPASASPQPVVQQPVPQPVVQQPVPQPVPQPPPQVARAEEPAAPRAREGDEVPAGTEGLTPPRMVSQAEVVYPQIARMQRVQGIVILSVHVSDNGRVLDVKVIRGDPRLNDAAVQSIRRSSFTPGTKDGVRVKSWVPVSVGFKL